MMNISNLVRKALVTTAIVASTMSFAADIDMNANADNIAISGYDTVAYFTMDKAVLGDADITSSYKNTTFQFVSTENRDLFNADKEKYVPQFGGYCAMGVAMNKKLDVDPHAWKIVDGKLYLNYNKDVQKAWLKDIPGNLKTAEENWPTVQNFSS